MHPGKNPEKSNLMITSVRGTHVRGKDDPIYRYDTPFAKDLLKSVRAEMKTTSWFAPAFFWIRLCIIALGTLFVEYQFATTGLMFWGILVGLFHAQIGLSVQHDASHGSLSKNSFYNALFSYGADWIGNSRYIWFQQHILWHHPHTNHPSLDPDASSAEPFLFFKDYSKKRHPVAPKSSWFPSKYQNYITHFILSLYGPSVVFNPYVYTLKHNDHVSSSLVRVFFSKHRLVSVMLRLFYFLRVTLLPYLSGASLLSSLFLVNVVCGINLTFLFVISHNFEGSDRDPTRISSEDKQDDVEIDWYKSQAETSCTYGGVTAMMLTGGLNMQIEHHLFPRLNSWHYPRIREVIQKCCQRHGVKYKYYPSVLSNTLSMLRYMRRVGVLHSVSAAIRHH